MPASVLAEGLSWTLRGKDLGVTLTPTTIAHDDLASGRLVRPVDEALQSAFGYWLLIPKTMADVSEVSDFRAWLLGEIDSSVGRLAQDSDRA